MRLRFFIDDMPPRSKRLQRDYEKSLRFLRGRTALLLGAASKLIAEQNNSKRDFPNVQSARPLEVLELSLAQIRSVYVVSMQMRTRTESCTMGRTGGVVPAISPRSRRASRLATRPLLTAMNFPRTISVKTFQIAALAGVFASQTLLAAAATPPTVHDEQQMTQLGSQLLQDADHAEQALQKKDDSAADNDIDDAMTVRSKLAQQATADGISMVVPRYTDLDDTEYLSTVAKKDDDKGNDFRKRRQLQEHTVADNGEVECRTDNVSGN
jgi:hypothetical protein